MIFVLGVVGFLWLLVWAGRRGGERSDLQRWTRAFVAALATVAAVAAALRGAWIASAGLIAVSVIVGGSIRSRRDPPDINSSMSHAQARSILGVGPAADSAEIEQAYRRLIRRVHPDAGGAAGLAAQLNAARDVLLK